MNTSKVIVTLDELNTLLTSQLQKAQEGGGVGSKITVQCTLREPDDNGCNWSGSIVLTVGPNSASETLRPFVNRLVQAAQMKYNVKEE